MELAEPLFFSLLLIRGRCSQPSSSQFSLYSARALSEISLNSTTCPFSDEEETGDCWLHFQKHNRNWAFTQNFSPADLRTLHKGGSLSSQLWNWGPKVISWIYEKNFPAPRYHLLNTATKISYKLLKIWLPQLQALIISKKNGNAKWHC